MLLQRLHLRVLRVRGADYFPTYALAVEVQSRLQRRILEYKASLSDPNPLPPPPPTLLTFTPAPTYTLGRRQVGPLAAAEAQRLAAPLRVESVRHQSVRYFKPAIVNAPRGGLATYHGPGQTVFWPVIDLHSPLHKHFTVRDYACLLERTTISALAHTTRVSTPHHKTLTCFTTENPGVWVRHAKKEESPSGSDQPGLVAHTNDQERKIAALGVHLRRHVTGLGVAVNVDTPVTGSEEVNPWARIVACGLEDKRVTSVFAELPGSIDEHDQRSHLVFKLLLKAWAADFETSLMAMKTVTMESESQMMAWNSFAAGGVSGVNEGSPGDDSDWINHGEGKYYDAGERAQAPEDHHQEAVTSSVVT